MLTMKGIYVVMYWGKCGILQLNKLLNNEPYDTGSCQVKTSHNVLIMKVEKSK